MGLVRKNLLVMGDKAEKEIDVLFNSGAIASFIKEDIANSLATFINLPVPKEFKLADNESKIKIKNIVHLDFKINGFTLWDEIFVAKTLPVDMIIGAKTMQAWKIKLDFEKENIIINPKAVELLLI